MKRRVHRLLVLVVSLLFVLATATSCSSPASTMSSDSTSPDAAATFGVPTSTVTP